jgi:hypothetical protein
MLLLTILMFMISLVMGRGWVRGRVPHCDWDETVLAVATSLGMGLLCRYGSSRQCYYDRRVRKEGYDAGPCGDSK